MNLTLDFEKKLDDFHLQISYEGDARRIGILGASGCGKSMTLRSIAGIEKPDRGRIVLGERTLYDSEKKINLRPQERRVGYLFQNYALFPTMTVLQNIMAGVQGSRQEKQKRAQEMVQAFQLEGLEKRRPGQLSGGQQQRVALARIMAYRPQALLLDEPFSAMDYFLRERLRLEMARVLEDYEGASILVTHDRDEAYQLCDHLLLMHEGQIIASGPTREVFDHPETVEAARLTGCKNITRIRPLGLHRICCLDWENLELTTEAEVTPDITHAGIRAHDFHPAEPAQQCAKTIIGAGEWQSSGSEEGKKRRLGGDITDLSVKRTDLPAEKTDLPAEKTDLPAEKTNLSEEKTGAACQIPESSRNLIPVENPVLTELPFEWYIVLEQGIWWKVPKDMHSHDFSSRIPASLTVEPGAVMLLKQTALSC